MRSALIAAALVLLALAFVQIPAFTGGQGAVSLSRPGHEDLTFWANHNGLEEIDVHGEVGFGDMARILMRRRSNSQQMRGLRDRFTFKVKEMAALETPDVFRAELTGQGLVWRNKPELVIMAAGRIFNLPVIVENRGSARGFFMKLSEAAPGRFKRKISLLAGDREIALELDLDVRPLAKLRVHLTEPARVYLTGADGLAYAPRGSISRITAMSAEYYFHAENSFEMDLPAGPTLIEATRGIEYELARHPVDLQPGSTTEVKVALKRWENMARRGLYSSDAHIHANYTAPHHQVITAQDVRLQALAEDLNNANMMVANSSGAFIHDEQHFEGKAHALSSPNFVIYWNEEMRNSGPYGHMCFYNLTRLVHPIYTGFPDTPQWEDYPPNYTQAEAAQKQGGAVTYAHPGYAPTFEGASARELPVDLALGQIDAMDVLSNNFEEATTELWYRLLNCGFRLAISAGTDAFTNVADHYTPGGGRVYAPAGERLNYAEWIRNYKRGRSFATNGPILMLAVNDSEPGDEIRLPAGKPQTVRVKCEVRSQLPLDKLEILVNGKPVISRKSLSLDEELRLESSSWIAARIQGPWHRLVLNDSHAFAHTSPVYVYLGDQRIVNRDDVGFYVDWIERLIARVEERGRFATPERKAEVITLFRRALDIYRLRLQ